MAGVHLRILVAHNIDPSVPGGMLRLMKFIHGPIVSDGHEVVWFDALSLSPRLSGTSAGRLLFPSLLLRYVYNQHRTGMPFDLINVHEPVGAPLLRFRRALKQPPSIVATCHASERRAWTILKNETTHGRQGPLLRSRLAQPTVNLPQAKFTLKHSDHVFCTNSEDFVYIHEVLGRKEQDITTISPGVKPAYFREIAFNTTARNLLFAGTWHKFKGVELLVPAVSEILERHQDATLTVLNPHQPAERVSQSFAPRVRSRVRCVATATEEENVAVFHDADVFLLPSICEGKPLVILEAMAAALPIVTTAIAGMRDLLKDEETALLIPPGSKDDIVKALERLLLEPETRARLGKNAACIARQYSWERAANQTLSVYRTLLEQRSARSTH